MPRSSRRRSGVRRFPSRGAVAAALLAALLAALAPATASAHAVVYPTASTPGAYEKYVLRVPNEKNVPTTRVEIRFPAGLRVVSFADVPGWRLETLTDSAGRVTGAVWTGTLPPQRFVELPFVAVNPRGDARLVWPAYQTYADGERVEWTGPEDGKTPASATTVQAAVSGDAGPGTVAPAGRTGLYLGGGALLLSFLSLGIALRERRP